MQLGVISNISLWKTLKEISIKSEDFLRILPKKD